MPVQAAAPTSAADYVAGGDRFARQGDSLRAEQYYRAAEDAGGDKEVIFARLVETCINAGRLGSAVRYVEQRLRREPESEALLRLSASLREALGHREAAFAHVISLERRVEQPSAETLLFLAEFYERQGDTAERTLAAYQRYEALVPPERRPPWVHVAVRRLTQLLEEKSQVARSTP